ncbi:MAG: hypothetical protein ACI9GM_001473 [Salibacteraceae bacterium]|jgi:hypothetical protein
MDVIPPPWFIDKFSPSLISIFPFGVTFAYCFIILLELTGPIILFIGGIKNVYHKKGNSLISIGFTICYVLFLTLTFGSFLVQDYSNGFNDFMYFIGILVIEQIYFTQPKK